MAKHASAGHAEVLARIEDGLLRVEVRDDGQAGARPDGSGLWGSPTDSPYSTAGSSRSTARRAAARELPPRSRLRRSGRSANT